MKDNLYYNDVNIKLLSYTLLKRKKILGLLKKEVFQIFNSKEMPVDISVFNS